MEANNAVKNNKISREEVLSIVREYLNSSAFTQRKLTDVPTDLLQVVSAKFVTQNGVTADRPTNPFIAQFYYDTTIGKPIWWNSSNWKDAAGNTV